MTEVCERVLTTKPEFAAFPQVRIKLLHAFDLFLGYEYKCLVHKSSGVFFFQLWYLCVCAFCLCVCTNVHSTILLLLLVLIITTPQAVLKVLCEAAPVQTYRAGECVLKQGDLSHFLFVVRVGKLMVCHADRTLRSAGGPSSMAQLAAEKELLNPLGGGSGKEEVRELAVYVLVMRVIAAERNSYHYPLPCHQAPITFFE